MMQAAGQRAAAQVPADKREAIGKAIEADVKKYVEEATPLVRERAVKLAPSTIGAVLEEKFTEDELKQLDRLARVAGQQEVRAGSARRCSSTLRRRSWSPRRARWSTRSCRRSTSACASSLGVPPAPPGVGRRRAARRAPGGPGPAGAEVARATRRA